MLRGCHYVYTTRYAMKMRYAAESVLIFSLTMRLRYAVMIAAAARAARYYSDPPRCRRLLMRACAMLPC